MNHKPTIPQEPCNTSAKRTSDNEVIKKMDVKNKILGSKKARGGIIAVVLVIITSYVVTAKWIPDSIATGLSVALGLTIGFVIKEAFDIKESWTLGLAVIIIGALFVALFVGKEVLILFVPVLIIMGLIYFHQKRFPKKKPK